MRNWSILCAGLALSGALFHGCSSREPKARPKQSSGTEVTGDQVAFTVSGMHCDGCAQAITEAVQALPGVKSVEVSFAEKRAVIVPMQGGLDPDAVVATIKKMGYEATPAAPATAAPSAGTR